MGNAHFIGGGLPKKKKKYMQSKQKRIYKCFNFFFLI